MHNIITQILLNLPHSNSGEFHRVVSYALITEMVESLFSFRGVTRDCTTRLTSISPELGSLGDCLFAHTLHAMTHPPVELAQQGQHTIYTYTHLISSCMRNSTCGAVSLLWLLRSGAAGMLLSCLEMLCDCVRLCFWLTGDDGWSYSKLCDSSDVWWSKSVRPSTYRAASWEALRSLCVSQSDRIHVVIGFSSGGKAEILHRCSVTTYYTMGLSDICAMYYDMTCDSRRPVYELWSNWCLSIQFSHVAGPSHVLRHEPCRHPPSLSRVPNWCIYISEGLFLYFTAVMLFRVSNPRYRHYKTHLHTAPCIVNETREGIISMKS